MSKELTNEEKKRLSCLRQNAVRKAWKEEQVRISKGYGTRNWTDEEQNQILQKGSVRGYAGHHMKSVCLYPQYAGDPNNIQFLNEDEHINGAHGGNTHNPTNGYYNPETKTMSEFGEGLGKIPVHKLSNSQNTENTKAVSSSFKARKNAYDHENNFQKSNYTNGCKIKNNLMDKLCRIICELIIDYT